MKYTTNGTMALFENSFKHVSVIHDYTSMTKIVPLSPDNGRSHGFAEPLATDTWETIAWPRTKRPMSQTQLRSRQRF